MGDAGDTARIYVGTDRSQLLAVKVLEYSIKRHASIPVELTPMVDLALPEPKDPRQGKRTGFSFARFAIPELAGRRFYEPTQRGFEKRVAERLEAIRAWVEAQRRSGGSA